MEAQFQYVGHKAHGAAAACEVKFDVTRGENSLPTVRLETAQKIKNSKQYDWTNKIAIQLTLKELTHLIAVLYGLMPVAEGKFHGQANNKSFRVTFEKDNQKGNYVSVLTSEGPSNQHNQPKQHSLRVELEDALMMGNIALVQYSKNVPGLSPEAALGAIKLLAARRVSEIKSSKR